MEGRGTAPPRVSWFCLMLSTHPIRQGNLQSALTAGGIFKLWSFGEGAAYSQGWADSGGRGNERGGLRAGGSDLGLSYERGDSTKLKAMGRREARFYLCLRAGRSSGVLLGTDDVPLASARYGK